MHQVHLKIPFSFNHYFTAVLEDSDPFHAVPVVLHSEGHSGERGAYGPWESQRELHHSLRCQNTEKNCF